MSSPVPDHAAGFERQRALYGATQPTERKVPAIIADLRGGHGRAADLIAALEAHADPVPAAELARQMAGLARLSAALVLATREAPPDAAA